MPAVDNKGDEKYWNNGESYDLVRLESARPGAETFYFEGETNIPTPPLQNFDTGKFFLDFE